MDKWEICICKTEEVDFHSPKDRAKSYQYKAFVKIFIDPQYGGGHSWNDSPKQLVLQWILNNGWEPYANITGVFYFRRKLESAE